MDILEEVRKLNFPGGEYIVVGSGIMDVLGIKKANDIDLVVAQNLFEELGQKGWKRIVRPNGKPGLEKGVVAAYLDVNCGDCHPTTEQLIKEAVVIKEIPFITLERLVSFKQAYAREKDFKDIALIKNYLNKSRPQGNM